MSEKTVINSRKKEKGFQGPPWPKVVRTISWGLGGWKEYVRCGSLKKCGLRYYFNSCRKFFEVCVPKQLWEGMWTSSSEARGRNKSVRSKREATGDRKEKRGETEGV